MDRVGPGLRVILLDPLPQTILRRKRARQNIRVFYRVVRGLVPKCEAGGL